MHAFIVIHGKPNIHGQKIREFIHRPDFEPGCYVWENRELTLEEHNAVVRKIVERHAILRPYTRLLPTKAPAADPRVEELEAKLVLRNEEVAQLRKALTPSGPPTGKPQTK